MLISCVATRNAQITTDNQPYNEYNGGRFGYSGVTIKLYSDSTYYYSEWNHTGQSINDNGKWTFQDERFQLQSSSRTRWTGRNSKSAKTYRFDMQEFTINGDTLKLVPKDITDNDYYETYYTLLQNNQNR